MPRREIIAYAAFGAVLAATWWHPIYPAEQALHNSLTAVALVALVALRRRLPFRSTALALAFLALHSVAARWLYSYVPYDEWTKALFGFSLNAKLGWTRDNFDRLVHITYGLCLGPILFWQFADRLGWRARWAAFAAVDIVLSTSALYELFEWAIAMTLSPASAEAYNGQQGDMWDAHKDMTCAVAAAIVVVALICLLRRLRPHPSNSSAAT
jgi:putative membrane protein